MACRVLLNHELILVSICTGYGIKRSQSWQTERNPTKERVKNKEARAAAATVVVGVPDRGTKAVRARTPEARVVRAEASTAKVVTAARAAAAVLDKDPERNKVRNAPRSIHSFEWMDGG